jgi:leucyl-tRNA synthetase
MSPFIPHFTSECLGMLDQKHMDWPNVSKDDLVEEEINFVVQINGKKRSLLRVKKDINENEILNEIKSNTEAKKLLKEQKILKTIFIPNRLINIIIQ